MNTQDGYEYLQNQSLRDGVRKQVEMKVFSLQQEMQDKKEAEKWFKENVNIKYQWNIQERYNEILRENLRKGVMKIVLEMFERKYGKPLQ